MKRFIAAVIPCLYACLLQAQLPYNGSFEHIDLQQFPLLWENASGNNFYEIKTDTSVAFSGKRSLHVKPADSVESPNMALTLYQKMQLEQLPKQSRVKIVFYITLQNEYIVDVYPYMQRSCSGGRSSSFNRKVEQVKKNEVMWNKVTYESPIDSNCTWVNWGLVVRGYTDVYIDNLEIYYGDQLVTDEEVPKDYQYPDTRQQAALQKSFTTISHKTVDDLPLADLSFLKKELAHTKVVALGESTHGTREFNVLRQKIIEYLITKLDFSVIVFENDFSGTVLASQLIANGQTHQALDSFFGRVHQTTEIEQLLNSIHDHNSKAGKKKVSMYGCDIQNIGGPVLLLKKLFPGNTTLAVHLDSLQNYAARIRPDLRNTDTLIKMATDIQTTFGTTENIPSSLPNRELIQQAFGHLIDACRFKKSIPLAYEQHGLYASIMRDSLMASHTQWIRQRHPNEKIIVWAHNSHIQKNESADGETPVSYVKSMGAYLAQELGAAYKAYALLTCSGTVTGYSQFGKPGIYALLQPDSSCYEYYLRPQKGTLSFFNVQQYNRLSKQTYLRGLRWRLIGYNVVPNKQFFYFHLNQKFDGIFTINSSTPANSFYANNHTK